MALMENIRGMRSDGDDSGGGKFNPFRILEIGESMVRYCDGIRIKDYNFLAILTSDRLVLIESAQQHIGTIAKEIPVSLIKGAVLERDEKNRPALGVSMEVGGQSRLMKLIFTGLIAEPETECREWYTALTGHAPEPELIEEPALPQAPPEPAAPPAAPPAVQEPVIDVEMAAPASPVVEEGPQTPIPPPVVPVPVPPAPKPEEPIEPAPIPSSAPIKAEVPPSNLPPEAPAQPSPVLVAEEVAEIPAPEPVRPVTPEPVKQEPFVPSPVPVPRQKLSVPARTDESVRICIEKPDIAPVRMERTLPHTAGSSSGKSRFCIHCGTRIPGAARFCPVCGKSQA